MNPADLCHLFRFARDHNLGLTTLHTLMFLLANGSVKMSALAKELGYSTAAATGTADRLEKLGLIGRGFAKDRRVILLQLTPKGHETITAALVAPTLI
jgi:DNA-binding MarR family transcriptional regulator